MSFHILLDMRLLTHYSLEHHPRLQIDLQTPSVLADLHDKDLLFCGLASDISHSVTKDLVFIEIVVMKYQISILHGSGMNDHNEKNTRKDAKVTLLLHLLIMIIDYHDNHNTSDHYGDLTINILGVLIHMRSIILMDIKSCRDFFILVYMWSITVRNMKPTCTCGW